MAAIKVAALILLFLTVAQAQNDAVSTEEKTESDLNTTPYEITLERPQNDGVPLTLMSFRPNYRHFPRGPLRKCRGFRRHGRDIPYGSDMILSGSDDLPDPTSWSKVVELEPRSDPIEWPRHHHHHHHRRHHHDGDEDRDHFPRHRHENEFLKGIRKFLGHF